MAEKNNSNCVICGKGYYLCMSCKDKMKIHPWKVLTDTSEHYKIFQVLKGFNNGVYNKEEAKNALLNCDLSDKKSFIDAVRNRIDAILADEETVDNKTVENNADECDQVNDENIETNVDVEVKTTPTKKRKAKQSGTA